MTRSYHFTDHAHFAVEEYLHRRAMAAGALANGAMDGARAQALVDRWGALAWALTGDNRLSLPYFRFCVAMADAKGVKFPTYEEAMGALTRMVGKAEEVEAARYANAYAADAQSDTHRPPLRPLTGMEEDAWFAQWHLLQRVRALRRLHETLTAAPVLPSGLQSHYRFIHAGRYPVLDVTDLEERKVA